jgi:hypothetical protein
VKSKTFEMQDQDQDQETKIEITEFLEKYPTADRFLYHLRGHRFHILKRVHAYNEQAERNHQHARWFDKSQNFTFFGQFAGGFTLGYFGEARNWRMVALGAGLLLVAKVGTYYTEEQYQAKRKLEIICNEGAEIHLWKLRQLESNLRDARVSEGTNWHVKFVQNGKWDGLSSFEFEVPIEWSGYEEQILDSDIRSEAEKKAESCELPKKTWFGKKFWDFEEQVEE